MKRAWLATALLAGWWLFGLGCFYPAGLPACVLVLVLGIVLLKDFPLPLPDPVQCAVGWGLLVPVVWWVPWPWRAAPLALWAGMLLGWLRLPVHEGRSAARALVAAGCVLVFQAAALWSYFALSAREHDLPLPLVHLVAAVVRLSGVETAVDGRYVVTQTMRQPHRLAATWEMLADPASVAFLAGGLVLLALAMRARISAHGRRGENGQSQGGLREWARAAGILALVVAAWLPLRAALLVAIYLHRVVCADSSLPLHVMNHFFSPWVLTALLGVPAALAATFVRWPGHGLARLAAEKSAPAAQQQEHESAQSSARAEGPEKLAAVGQSAAAGNPAAGRRAECEAHAASHTPGALRGRDVAANVPPSTSETTWGAPGALRRPAAAGALIALAGALAAVGLWAEPLGQRKPGRVMFVERHSEWEPSDHPYDTETYGELSSYNYKAAYDYLGQYYEMSRLLESEPIDDRRLAACDVLVIKTPTARYSRPEIEAVVRFVRRGGGLLFVGDHTNYERSSTYMNDIARQFGFAFRHDLLFSFGPSPYEQVFRRGWLPHPAVQHVAEMDFAVSCSIDPGLSAGRAAIRSLGLWNMPPEYHIENFHPFPQHCPEMRYGAFIQLWATRYGQGRVLAFTDSTIFSNFCIFQPGKAELLRGMVEWLNHRGGRSAGWLVLAFALLPAGAGIWLAAKERTGAAADEGPGRWLLLAAAALCGMVLAVQGAAFWARRQMPVPEAKRPLPLVVVDRTTSAVPLSKGAYTQGEGQGYGLLEQWIARLGYLTARRSGAEAFEGQALVVICPSRSVSPEFRAQLVRYVTEGGRLLVIDSPENETTTADSLLWPFGLSFERDQPWSGTLSATSQPWTGMPGNRPAAAREWPGLRVERAWSIQGGQPVVQIGLKPVAVAQRYGKGLVMAVGFGSAFNDTNMGDNWMTVPDAALRRRFDTLFALLQYLVEDRPIGPLGREPSAPAAPPLPPRPGAPLLPEESVPSAPLAPEGAVPSVPEGPAELPTPPGVVAPPK